MNPIAGITCGEVIEVGLELAKEYGLDERYIVKKPADGLTGKTDEENFGFTYEDVDRIVSGEMPSSAEVGMRILEMHAATEHKRRMPYCFGRKVN